MPSEKNLLCAAWAFPAPVITWYRDGKGINVTNCADDNDIYVIRDSGSKVSTSSKLKIKKTQYLRDSGTYTCVAKNDYGTDSLDIILDVQGENTL